MGQKRNFPQRGLIKVYCILLYCTVFYFIVLFVLFYIVLYCIVLYCTKKKSTEGEKGTNYRKKIPSVRILESIIIHYWSKSRK